MLLPYFTASSSSNFLLLHKEDVLSQQPKIISSRRMWICIHWLSCYDRYASHRCTLGAHHTHHRSLLLLFFSNKKWLPPTLIWQIFWRERQSYQPWKHIFENQDFHVTSNTRPLELCFSNPFLSRFPPKKVFSWFWKFINREPLGPPVSLQKEGTIWNSISLMNSDLPL